MPKAVVAEPGYFKLDLMNNVTAEMTTSHHAALFSFFFSGPLTKDPLILLDLTDLHGSRIRNSTVSVDPQTGRIIGTSTFKPSFGIGSYVAHVCVDFTGPKIRDSGIFIDNRASSSLHNLTLPDREFTNSSPLPGGAWVRFIARQNRAVLARVGISMQNSDKACQNAEREIPDFGFRRIKADARRQWQMKLNRVEASKEGLKDGKLLTSFYSGIYRTMINPQDWTGENPLWKSTEPYFDSFYW